jgi:hypothetical protein
MKDCARKQRRGGRQRSLGQFNAGRVSLRQGRMVFNLAQKPIHSRLLEGTPRPICS